MTLPQTAVAAGYSLETRHRPKHDGVTRFAPQRIVVIGQGQTGVTYSSDKMESVESAEAVGDVVGYNSPLYGALLELLPANSALGVGNVEIDVLPLQDHASGVAATGDITPSGTPTKTQTYFPRIGGVLGAAFSIVKSASPIVVNDVLAEIGRSILSVLHMPVTVDYSYGTVTQAADAGNTGNGTVGTLSVTGTPYPGAWRLECITAVTNGGVFKLTDPFGTIVSNSLTMTVGVGEATVFDVGGIQFTVTDSTTDFVVGDAFTITVPATKIDLTAGWEGASGNKIGLEIVDINGKVPDAGVSFAFTQMAGGATNPDVQSALDAIGETWNTLVVNCLEIEDTVALGKYDLFGEARWGNLVRKPLYVFTGVQIGTSVGDATAVSNGRPTDRTNVQIPVPGSPNMPHIIAAAAVAAVARVANENPAKGYTLQRLPTITPGTDAQQWDWALRDSAVKKGSSTTLIRDKVVHLSDVVTMYKPTGQEPPAYRQVVTGIKLMQLIYNTELLFNTEEWAAAPLLPDNQETENSAAKKPYMAKQALFEMVQTMGRQAVVSIDDAAALLQSISAQINSGNPDRLDFVYAPQVSGNTFIKDGLLLWSFYFGSN